MTDPKKNLSGKVILIVEDDPISSEFLNEVLSGVGIRMIFTRTGEDALRICRENREIDLVLMDIRLPGKNGYITTGELKSILPDLPVIAQTAYALEGDRDKAMEAGCDGYISKPIKAAELINLISSFL